MKTNFIISCKEMVVSGVKKNWRWLLIGVILGIVIMNVFSVHYSKDEFRHVTEDHAGSTGQNLKYWTCSMHPQIKLPDPGKCPICAMDLIPVYEKTGSFDEEVVSLKLNETGRRLAEVETTLVRYAEVSHEIRLVGKVEYDETRLSFISAWVPGRIDRLFVDFTGTKVRKNDHLIELYSPELFAAQEEYIQAIENLEASKGSKLNTIRRTSRATLRSAREKLRLLGIDETQIEAMSKRRKPRELLVIRAPVAGTVINKNGFEGMYVKTGDKIYTIADLSRVWLYLDAYESDIQWLHYGQRVLVEAESYPGEVFEGKIAFIDPFVNERTRTIKLRVNVDNKGEKLKPGMFVRATIKALLGEEGRVYQEDLAGKWICPMHPDIVKSFNDQCDECGMDLISTVEFGFADEQIKIRKALVIPKTAPLITGKRAIVYIEREAAEDSLYRYEGREVVLGPRAGDHYIVFSGVQEGERVVTKGNFKIDSALQIQAKPSMMNPAEYYYTGEGTILAGGETEYQNASILLPAIRHYFQAQEALSIDNTENAVQALNKFKEAIDTLINKHSLVTVQRGIGKEIKDLSETINVVSKEISKLRSQFRRISLVLKKIFDVYEYREDLRIYLMMCPMYEQGKETYWLQKGKQTANPYLGKKMLQCGQIIKEYGRKLDLAPEASTMAVESNSHQMHNH